VDRSLRRLGQLLVIMGALLGAVLGVALALIVNNADSSGPVAASGRAVSAAVSTSPPSSRPPAAREASSQDPVDDSTAAGTRRAESAGRADQQDAKPDKHRKGKPDGRGNDKPGKGKGK
jgi:hypothetical protein